jgi:hypothetical protein
MKLLARGSITDPSALAPISTKRCDWWGSSRWMA